MNWPLGPRLIALAVFAVLTAGVYLLANWYVVSVPHSWLLPSLALLFAGLFIWLGVAAWLDRDILRQRLADRRRDKRARQIGRRGPLE